MQHFSLMEDRHISFFGLLLEEILKKITVTAKNNYNWLENDRAAFLITKSNRISQSFKQSDLTFPVCPELFQFCH